MIEEKIIVLQALLTEYFNCVCRIDPVGNTILVTCSIDHKKFQVNINEDDFTKHNLYSIFGTICKMIESMMED